MQILSLSLPLIFALVVLCEIHPALTVAGGAGLALVLSALIAIRRPDLDAVGGGIGFERLFDTMPMPALIFDTENLAILAVNDAAVDCYGFTRKEFMKLKMMQLGPVEELAARAKAPGDGNGVIRLRHRRKDGVWMEVQAVVRESKRDGCSSHIVLMHHAAADARAEEELRVKEETILALLNARTDSALLLDLDGTILAANETAAARIGLPPDRLRGKNIYDCFEQNVAETRRHKFQAAIKSGRAVRFEDERGGLIFDNNIVPVRGAGGAIDRVAVFASDVTERKKAEEGLKASEAKYRTLVTVMKEGLMAVDRHDVINFVNPRVCEMLGFDSAEMLGRSVSTFLADDGSKRLLEEKSHLRSAGVSDSYELAMRTRSGRILNVLVSGTPVVDEGGTIVGSLGVLTDISDRKRTEEKIRAALTEKTVLLKEIHHRVKNNLQVISSLLSLQSSHIGDETSRELFKESQNRIRSMALVHEKLYQSRDLSRIDCNEYLKSLAVNLFRSYGGEARGIALRVDTHDALLGIDAAIPCGLIVNELVTNSLKYAFPQTDGTVGPEPREVFIELRALPDDSIWLCVGDNGVGFPDRVDFRSTSSLGMQLVNVLTEQLCGTVELDRTAGTRFTITFSG